MFSYQTTRRHSGFTLVELLFVISIIAVLASMMVGVMRGARTDANIAATKARTSLIERILLEEFENYEVRRLPIALNILQKYVEDHPNGAVDSDGDDATYVQLKNLRRRIIADLINCEMPRPIYDSINDEFLVNPDLGVFPSTEPSIDSPGPNFNLGFLAWLNTVYPNPIDIDDDGTDDYPPLANLLTAVTSGATADWWQYNPANPAYAGPDPTNRPGLGFNLPGEHLYQILSRIQYQGTTAIDSLGNQAVGDTDNDGYLEVIDAWGDALEMRIFQVGIDDTDPSYSDLTKGRNQDVFVDLVTDWTYRNPVNNPFRIPQGFVTLNPAISRPIDDIRVEVVSINTRDLQQ